MALLASIAGYTQASVADSQQWELEAYGGRYYGSERAALYGAYTHGLAGDLAFTAEALHEEIDDYRFRGLGGHLFWQFSEDSKAGVFASTISESYGGGIDRDFSTAGLEIEMNVGRFSLAAQGGGVFSANDEIEGDTYTSAELYYWGQDEEWYLRSGMQRPEDDSLYFAEAYGSWSAAGIPITPYVGASTGASESVYSGAYFELFSSQKAVLFVDLGGGRVDGEWVLQLELDITFGPGANRPYISAFGFTVTD